MEIIKYKKKKNNIYEITFGDNTTALLYDDVIIKYEILLKKKISENELNKIMKYNKSLEAYYLSLNYITKKMKCEKEIEYYLKNKEYNDNDIKGAINRLKKEGYLNREEYIKSYINDAYKFKMDGPLKTKKNLIDLGFLEEEISSYLNLDYQEKVIKIIDKKLKYNKLSNNNFKNKIKIYLINLGYPQEIFIDYLSNITINDKDKLYKDFELLLKKYKNKYEDNKLKYFIKDKLYKKGYNIEQISEVCNELL